MQGRSPEKARPGFQRKQASTETDRSETVTKASGEDSREDAKPAAEILVQLSADPLLAGFRIEATDDQYKIRFFKGRSKQAHGHLWWSPSSRARGFQYSARLWVCPVERLSNLPQII